MFAFALKTVVLVSNVFTSLRKKFLFYLMCSLRFENNLLSSEGVRFALISKKTLLSKLSFAFVSLALPLLVGRELKARVYYGAVSVAWYVMDGVALLGFA